MRPLIASHALILIVPFAAIAGDPVVEFDPDDPEMNAAIVEAHKTLPRFLRNVFSQGIAASEASLKVAIPYGNNDNAEVIWVASLTQRSADTYQGRLANNPVHLAGMSLGDAVQFSSDQIRDWSYTDPGSGMLFGHYTTRVVIQQIDAAQRREVEKILAKPPVPSNW